MLWLERGKNMGQQQTILPEPTVPNQTEAPQKGIHFCTNCGAPSQKKICPNCGVKRNKTHNFCAWCGLAIDPNAKKCPHCQEPVRTSVVEKIFTVFIFIYCFFVFIYAIVGRWGAAEIAEEKQIYVVLTRIAYLLAGVTILFATRKIIFRWTHNKYKIRFAVRVLCILMSFVFFGCANTLEDKVYYHVDRDVAIEKALPYANLTPDDTASEPVVSVDENISSDETAQAVYEFYGLDRDDTDIVIIEFDVDYGDNSNNVDWAEYTVYFLFNRLTGEYIPFDRMCYVESTNSFTNYNITFHLVQ